VPAPRALTELPLSLCLVQILARALSLLLARSHSRYLDPRCTTTTFLYFNI